MTKKIHKVYGSIILVLSLLFVFLAWEAYIKVSYEYYIRYYGHLAMLVCSDYVIPKNADTNSLDNDKKTDMAARMVRYQLLRGYFGCIKMGDKYWNIKLAKKFYQNEEQRLWCESIRKKAFEIIEREKPVCRAHIQAQTSQLRSKRKPMSEEEVKQIDEIIFKQIKVLDESLFNEP